MKPVDAKHKAWVMLAGFLVAAAFVFAGVAWAASPVGQGQVGDAALETLLKREQLAFDGQTARLKAANTIISKTQTWINGLKSAGKNTSALETALATYQGQIASAQADHDAGGSLLSSKAGFDANGKVTDRQAALSTIKSAGKSLRQSHLTLVQSTLDFRDAVRNWRAAN
jgi:hypothetical protein